MNTEISTLLIHTFHSKRKTQTENANAFHRSCHSEDNLLEKKKTSEKLFVYYALRFAIYFLKLKVQLASTAAQVLDVRGIYTQRTLTIGPYQSTSKTTLNCMKTGSFTVRYVPKITVSSFLINRMQAAPMRRKPVILFLSDTSPEEQRFLLSKYLINQVHRVMISFNYQKTHSWKQKG